jgi:isoleucyl-tRNA synthetase
MKVSSLGRAARSQAGIKVRQPLDKVIVSVASHSEQGSLERTKSQILEELNVKDLKIAGYSEVAKLDGHGYVVSGLEQKIDEEKGYKVLTGGGVYLVAVPTEIPPELQAEGMAREVVHRLQIMRRSAGFDIADYITTYYQGDAYMRQIMEDFADYIKQETLSRKLVEGIPEQEVFTESYKLGGYEILLGVKRLG